MVDPRFYVAYRAWLDDCLQEWNDKHDFKRKYHQDNVPKDLDDVALLVEFTEDGNAYPHGIGGTNVIKGAVTPWYKSIYFSDSW